MKDTFEKTISIRVTKNDFDMLRKIRESYSISPSQIIRHALLKHIVDLSDNLKVSNDDK